MSDYYRDRVRHGGILSNTFINRWWTRQVVSNQYGLAGKAERDWGPDTIDGDLSENVLVSNRRDQTVDTARYKFRDDEYYSSKDFELARIEVPLLSVGNWVSSFYYFSRLALNQYREVYCYTYVETWLGTCTPVRSASTCVSSPGDMIYHSTINRRWPCNCRS